MDDLLLIKLVKRNELLYDKNNRDYKCIEKKEAAWKRIGKELGVSDEDCSRRWFVLRGRYTRESRRITALANNGMTTTSFWPLLYELDFLKPHIVQRRGRLVFRVRDEPAENSSQSFVSENDDNEQHYEYVTDNIQLKYSIGPMSDQEEEIIQEDIEAIEQSDSESYSQYAEINPLKLEKQPKVLHKITPSSTSRQRNTRKRHYESDTESANELTSALESFKKWCGTKRSRHRNPAVHGFGQMMVETLCGMSERKQAMAMQKVTEIVMTLKMEPDCV
ncbi:uncharacterized protein [Eurosta solidaginis]|uniref:uncharacterized protein n=1 Tax=Eurosta solidaginis TaxID=178769 RepID=UPI00353101D7